MLGYIEKQLQKCKHPYPMKPQDGPFPAPPLKYVHDAQQPILNDTSPH